jgi:CheY-like chemotaxis protein
MTDLALETELMPEQREYIELVKVSANSLMGVINNILDFSKIEAGKLSVDPVEFNVRDVLADAVKMLAPRAQQKGLELVFHVQSTVPEIVRGDSMRLRQILVNLVGNAVKFTERGEIVVRAALHSAPVDNQLTIHWTVRDTGIGIAPDKHQVIFEPFVQADGSTTRRYGGTGLGLAICARLAELMEGNIWVESETGRGSSFHFTTRFELAADSSVAKAPPPEVLRDAPILIVEDNPSSLQVFHEQACEWQMKPTTAATAAEALAILEAAARTDQPFPYVLIDSTLSEVDGFALAETIRYSPALSESAVVVLSTTLSSERCRQNSGALALTKPARSADLLQALLSSRDWRNTGSNTCRLATERNVVAPCAHLRVLLAEDNPVNQKLAVRFLEQRGCEVTLAADGSEAISLLGEQSFDLVLTDLQMPVKGGVEVAAWVREQERGTAEHLPIVALTAHAMSADRQRCLLAGMDGYLAKPISQDELWSVIEVVCPQAPRFRALATETDTLQENLDRTAILNRLDGDEQLLREIVDLFFLRCPELLEGIRQGLVEGNARAVQQAAHSLKGAVSTFSRARLFEILQQIEDSARALELEQANQAFQTLETELNRFHPALAQLVAA